MYRVTHRVACRSYLHADLPPSCGKAALSIEDMGMVIVEAVPDVLRKMTDHKFKKTLNRIVSDCRSGGATPRQCRFVRQFYDAVRASQSNGTVRRYIP